MPVAWFRVSAHRQQKTRVPYSKRGEGGLDEAVIRRPGCCRTHKVTKSRGDAMLAARLPNIKGDYSSSHSSVTQELGHCPPLTPAKREEDVDVAQLAASHTAVSGSSQQ